MNSQILSAITRAGDYCFSEARPMQFYYARTDSCESLCYIVCNGAAVEVLSLIQVIQRLSVNYFCSAKLRSTVVKIVFCKLEWVNPMCTSRKGFKCLKGSFLPSVV